MITPAISVLSRGRGAGGRDAVLQALRRADHDRHPDRPVRRPAARHRRRSARLRPGDDGLVRRRSALLGRPLDRRASRRVLAAVNPLHAVRFFVDERLARLPRARLGLPGGHRRRGALRRHGPLRRAADPDRLVQPRAARRCCSTTSARARCCSRNPDAGAQSVLPAGAGAGRSIRWWCSRRAPTVIASQAVISGAFSLTRQAVQLGYCPRDRDRPHLGARRSARSTSRRSTGC